MDFFKSSRVSNVVAVIFTLFVLCQAVAQQNFVPPSDRGALKNEELIKYTNRLWLRYLDDPQFVNKASETIKQSVERLKEKCRTSFSTAFSCDEVKSENIFLSQDGESKVYGKAQGLVFEINAELFLLENSVENVSAKLAQLYWSNTDSNLKVQIQEELEKRTGSTLIGGQPAYEFGRNFCYPKCANKEELERYVLQFRPMPVNNDGALLGEQRLKKLVGIRVVNVNNIPLTFTCLFNGTALEEKVARLVINTPPCHVLTLEELTDVRELNSATATDLKFKATVQNGAILTGTYILSEKASYILIRSVPYLQKAGKLGGSLRFTGYIGVLSAGIAAGSYLLTDEDIVTAVPMDPKYGQIKQKNLIFVLARAREALRHDMLDLNEFKKDLNLALRKFIFQTQFQLVQWNK